MTRKYWAIYYDPALSEDHKVGPFEDRMFALAAMREVIRCYGIQTGYRDRIMSGYGSEGPYFDIRWDVVTEE